MSSPVATPPVWKVRIVSCVPGSANDWAAMMPRPAHIHQLAVGHVGAVAERRTRTCSLRQVSTERTFIP
jgi:hypothetical protein